MKLAIALPLSVDRQMVGTCFIAARRENTLALVTALHLLGSGKAFQIGIPPHLGDLSTPQKYPLPRISAVEAKLTLAEPSLDIGILTFSNDTMTSPIPSYVKDTQEIRVGEEVIIVGYPFCPIGSFLETASIARVSAIGNRVNPSGEGNLELILSVQTHPGSSGSPVLRRSDGHVCGVIRGCLAPPGVLSIGNMPLGTDTNVTFATGSSHLSALINEAFEMSEVL